MPKIYKRNCDNCGEYYEGRGEKYCSAECRDEARIPQGNDVQQALNLLTAKGYQLTKVPIVADRKFEVDTSRFDGDNYKVGVVGDTQLGSKYAQLTHLNTAYEYFKQEGITDVLHLGDFTDGQHMYKGHEFELAVHGAENQIDYAVNRYPKIDGITTHVIAGNHDCSFIKSEGLDILNRISKEREDINYLGALGAYLIFGDVKIYLHHPDGGNSYARSYKIQKVIEQFAPERKPNIYIGGHLHINCVLPMYRNVYGILCGCFQSQTPYLVAKNLYPEIGFGILEFTSNDGLAKTKYEWLPFYNPIPNDY